MFLPSNITLQFGDSGDFVAELQRRLARMRCFDEAMVNGFYDGPTVTGVSAFQSQAGLQVDGVAGPETLRRLNGVISGDTGSTSSDDKKAEEEAAARDHSRQQQIQAEFLAQQNTITPTPYGEARYEKPLEATSVTATAATPEFMRDPTTAAPLSERTAPVNDPQQALREQNLREPVTTQPSASNANDILVQMLLQSAQQAQPLTPAAPAASSQPSPLQAATTAVFSRPPLETAPPLPTTSLPPIPALPTSDMPLPPTSASPAMPTALPPTQTAEPKGIVGRAIQTVSSYIDKLGAYFEAKLPPSVMHEVKAIGEVMAKSGMRETAIPGGPELPTRAQELPGRATPQTPQRN